MRKILILAAIIPAIALMVYVYKKDRTSKEPLILLAVLVLCGLFATQFAAKIEELGEMVLVRFVNSVDAYNFIYYFGVVAYAEEGLKYLLLKKATWKSSAFDSTFDGIIYAVFVSAGFALFENISYVLTYGFQVAVSRAITAVPMHCCFGVLMGVFYGVSKRNANNGHEIESKKDGILALIVPAFIHGLYDYIVVTANTWLMIVIFIIGLVSLYILCVYIINKSSKNDRIM